MKFSRKQFVDAYHYTSPEQLKEFKQISNEQTHIDSRHRLQFYYNEREHIGVPLNFWLVNDGMWKTFTGVNFEKIYTCEEIKQLKQTPYGCNPVYPERPYPNNIHAIKQILGLSNDKLGMLVGVGYTKIANIDRGDKPIDDTLRYLIEQATGYEVRRYYE